MPVDGRKADATSELTSFAGQKASIGGTRPSP
jgi:hypothetical protein